MSHDPQLKPHWRLCPLCNQVRPVARRQSACGKCLHARDKHRKRSADVERRSSLGQEFRMKYVLIYADMVAKTGKIDYLSRETWPYQPTEAEIRAALEGMPR